MKTSVTFFSCLVLGMVCLALSRGLNDQETAFKRVKGGSPADTDKYNYLVKVERLGKKKYPFCHGAILSENWVMSSALCLHSTDAKDLNVIAGTKSSEGKTVSGVEKVIVHDDYNKKTVVNDLVLLKLDSELTLGTSDGSLKAIDIPSQGEAETTGATCFMAGHGYTDVKEPANDKSDLFEVELKIIDDKSCAKKMNPLFKVDQPSMFCADGKDESACLLDQGTPLACKEGDKLVARGLFSWCHIKCDPSYYNVFTRLSNYADWIKKTMDSE